jgi:hypothetical protein
MDFKIVGKAWQVILRVREQLKANSPARRRGISSSREHCEDGSADRGNLLRGHKTVEKRDYIGEFMLIDRPEGERGFCEDIADV